MPSIRSYLNRRRGEQVVTVSAIQIDIQAKSVKRAEEGEDKFKGDHGLYFLSFDHNSGKDRISNFRPIVKLIFHVGYTAINSLSDTTVQPTAGSLILTRQCPLSETESYQPNQRRCHPLLRFP